jgi:prophage regulatory protein
MAKKGHSDPFTLRFVASDSEDGAGGCRPSEPIPPELQGFDPRIVELVRLLARETACEVIERSLRDANLAGRHALHASALTHVTSHRFRRTIRRPQLRHIVPLADTTIYEMAQRGEFPRRFHLTPRCVVWDLAEVEAWIEERRRASEAGAIETAPSPDVRQRKGRPVRR